MPAADPHPDTDAAASDTEITLAADDYRLCVSPFGASLRGLWREAPDGSTTDIICAYHGAKNKVGGQGDVLIPFPGRVRGGRYTFDGTTYQMPINDREGPNAIHGFLRSVVWEAAEQSERAVTFTTTLAPEDHPGYPFSLHVSAAYMVGDGGMTCRFRIMNSGTGSAPVAAGFHPYFTVGSERIDIDELQLPFTSMLEFEALVPTGRVLPIDGTPFDFRSPRPIGDTVLNTCFLNPIRDPDGNVRIHLRDSTSGNTTIVWMDHGLDYLVVYSGDPLPEPHRRRMLAIEPMSCASDAFNYPAWGLVTLAPGASFTGSWGVTAP